MTAETGPRGVTADDQELEDDGPTNGDAGSPGRTAPEGIANKTYAVGVNISDGSSITAINARHGQLRFGTGWNGKDFNPIELLLAAVGGCAAIDFNAVIAKRGYPLNTLDIEVTAQKAKDERLESLQVRYFVPEDADIPSEDLAVALRLTADVLCAVSRTLVRSSQVDHVIVTTSAPDTSGGENALAQVRGGVNDMRTREPPLIE
jgi:putative redox protein